ncbi:MAG: DUF4293 domain-containing protein [Bacteroidota bacterium]
MIQRKQTLFLLAVAVIAIIQIFIPFQIYTFNETSWQICLMPGCSADIISNNIYAPMIINNLVMVLSVAVIFLYRNRVLQYKLANLLILFNVFITGLFFLLPFVNVSPAGIINYSFGSFLPLVSAVFAFLAAHFIKKDEQLVRSADRIR